MVLKTAFETQLAKLESLIAAAGDDPSRGLFKNGARTPLFMLEALGRLAEDAYPDAEFEKITVRFKTAEDAIGAIDYYDAAASDLEKHPSVPPASIVYLRAKANESLAAFEKLLQSDGWLDGSRLARIRKRLAKMDWKSSNRELTMIEKSYDKSIRKIVKQFGAPGYEFAELETEVHELRRKLRWLSIYPQALGGAVQMSADSGGDPRLATYLTPEIVSSPFNRFPAPPANLPVALVVGRDDFLALSWMIAELGRLKDEGLLLLALSQAISMTESLSMPAASDRAHDLLGSRAVWEILRLAGTISADYFRIGSLAHLVRGVQTTPSPTPPPPAA